MSTAKACNHLDAPHLEVLFVIDSHLHFTDGYVRCRVCQQHYLVELADLAGTAAAFKISPLPQAAVAATIRSLEKGSCDLNRARNEVFNVAAQSQPLRAVLLMYKGEFTGLAPLPDGVRLPNRSWRELPCDGALLAAIEQAPAQARTEPQAGRS